MFYLDYELAKLPKKKNIDFDYRVSKLPALSKMSLQINEVNTTCLL